MNTDTERHICKTCTTELTDAQYENGKMCCDKPMFHDDFDIDEYDNWFDSKYPECACFRCDTKLNSRSVVMCGGNGDCETWYCNECYDDGTYDCPVCRSMNDEEPNDEVLVFTDKGNKEYRYSVRDCLKHAPYYDDDSLKIVAIGSRGTQYTMFIAPSN